MQLKKFSRFFTIVLAMTTMAPPLKQMTQATCFSAVLFETGAWCWFADPRAIRHVNNVLGIDYTYIGAIDYKGQIKVAQYNNITKAEYTKTIAEGFERDDHDNPTFTTLPDGRVIVFYMKHDTDGILHYRITDKTGNLETLRAEKTIDVTNGTDSMRTRGSYPSVFVLKDQPDKLYLLWRGAPNRWPTVMALSLPDKNDNITRLVGHKSLVAPGTAPGNIAERPYAKYLSNGKDRIYLTFTYDHPQDHKVNPVYFAYFDVNEYKLYEVTGNALADIMTGPYYISKTATGPVVVDNEKFIYNGKSHESGWVWDMAIGRDANPVIVYTKINSVDGDTRTEKDSHQYFYSKWTGTKWEKAHIADGGKWFHQGGDYEMCYSGGMTLDKGEPTRMFASVPQNGVYEIEQITMREDVTIDSREWVTTGSSQNNVRPYVLNNAQPTDQYYLLWMNGTYRDWKYVNIFNAGFSTAIHYATRIPHPSYEVGHHFTWTTVKEPSCSEEGLQEGACDTCDYKSTAPIRKLPHTDADGICDDCGAKICNCCDKHEHEDSCWGRIGCAFCKVWKWIVRYVFFGWAWMAR